MRHYTLNKYLSRLVAVLLCLALTAACFPAALATETSMNPEPTQIIQEMEDPPLTASGSCGAGLNWSFAEGTLSITGSGAMDNFPESTMAPWYSLRGQILRVELPQGLTSIGDLAFYECKNITTLVIPDSVRRIGSYAFAECQSLELLNLGRGVESIGECAFSDCYRIVSLNLPQSLRTIGTKAFYRCESVSILTVPAGVTSIGVNAFGYCKALVSADIRASITSVPEFLFYGCGNLVSVKLPDTASGISEFAFRGCESLSTVYYEGENKTPEEIQEIIEEDVPGFINTGHVSSDENTGPIISGTTTVNPDGSVTQQNTTVVPGEGSTVSTTITDIHPENTLTGEVSSEITVVVDDESGWQEASDAVQDSLTDISGVIANTGGTSTPTEIIVYVQNPGEIDQDFIDNLSNRDLNITIVSQDGSVWKINTGDMESGSGIYDLRYTLSPGDQELCLEMAASSCFRLKFQNTAQINAQVLIRIGPEYMLQNATLFQRQDKELTRRQSTVVDKDGYVHLYLASVDADSEYYLAMNLTDAAQEALIPQELSAEYAAPVNVQPIQYEITGRTSSWGMTFNQVTWIMVAFLGTTVIVVGIVMYSLNKRRLRMGYVPDLDDEYDE